FISAKRPMSPIGTFETCRPVLKMSVHRGRLNRYSLGTKNKTLKYNADGSLTIYAGAKSPGANKESNWLPAPDDAFSLYIRAYWADKAIIDGSWTPPVVQRVN